MTAQVIVDKARFWPERLRPDAMLLITHTGRIADAAVQGSMAQAWGIAEHTDGAGLDQRADRALHAPARPGRAARHSAGEYRHRAGQPGRRDAFRERAGC